MTTHRQSTMTQFYQNGVTTSVPVQSQVMLSKVQPILVQQACPQTNMIVDPASAQMAQLIQDNQNLFAENAARSQQEQTILNAWQNERSKFNSLLQNLTQTNQQLTLKIHNLELKFLDIYLGIKVNEPAIFVITLY